MTDISALLQAPVHLPAWRGLWSRLWVRPDVFSAQEYIVGAIAIEDGRVHDFRVLSGADRFLCIYGEDARQFFDQLIGDVRDVLAQARASKLALEELGLSPSFRVETVGALRGQLPGESLDRMLRDGTIPLEPEEPAGKRARFASRAAAEVVQEVIQEVKAAAGFDAHKFLREDHFGDQAHQVGVNLVTPRAAGIVASGWYARPDKVQLEFLLAASKVDAYAAAKHRTHSAVFFCRPTMADGLTQDNWLDIESKLSELEWRMGQRHARVVTHDQPAFLAKEIVDWAREFA